MTGNSHMANLTDEELLAFADKRLPEARAKEVAALIESDPDLSRRIEAWRAQSAGLHALYDSILDEPVPLALHPASLRKRLWAGRTQAFMRIAAVLLLAVMSGVGGWWLRGDSLPDQTADLEAEAVRAHEVFVAEKRHPVEVAAAEADHLTQWLSKRMSTDIRLPDLTQLGLTLIGGRLLPSEQGAAVQLMYEAENGDRITLYISHLDKPGETAFRFIEGGAVSVCFWQEGHLAFAVVGPWDRERMMKAAEVAYDAFEA